MFLYLLRHGDAIQNPSLIDSERPLSDLGRHQAEAVGKFLHSSKVHLDRILSSPLVRAVETAEITAQILGVRELEQTEYLVPGTRKKQLLDLLNSMGLKSILLVGHEPHLSKTVSLLLSERDNLALEFKKCSLACLVASEPLREGHAALQSLLTFDQMELLQR
jgi:phosphohistidine phosphatase